MAGGGASARGLTRRSLLGAALLAAGQPGQSRADAQRPDAARFFRAPQMLDAALAPDGKRLAMVMIGPHGRALLSVLDLETMKPAVAYAAKDADVGSVVWVNALRLAFTLVQRAVPEGRIELAPGLFAVDHDGTNFRQLVDQASAPWVADGDKPRSMEPWNTFLLNGTSQRRGDDVLAVRPEAYDGKDFGYVRLLRLNTRRGGTHEVEAPLHSVAWWPDAAGELRAVLTRQGEKSTLRWRNPADGQWKLLSEFNTYTEGHELQVRHVGADGLLYVSAQRDGDKLALWQLNPQTGA
ncbi:MAG: hypothetical protein C0505_04965 [Leptothrix sp. (in: Bacteria)]|nr:hypothetical protein [Leptothrix sp. (in: b-proteobacteria)]